MSIKYTYQPIKLDFSSRVNLLLIKNKCKLYFISSINFLYFLVRSYLLFFYQLNYNNELINSIRTIIWFVYIPSILTKLYDNYLLYLLNNNKITNQELVKKSKKFVIITSGFGWIYSVCIFYYYFKIPSPYFQNYYYIYMNYEFWYLVVSISICSFLVIMYYYYPSNFMVQFILKNVLLIENEDFNITSSNNKKTFNEECSICLEKINKKFKLECGHCFHKKCISQWIINNPKCPNCKKTVLKEKKWI